MKKLITFSLLALCGSYAAANSNIGPAGCGLGNMLFGKDTQILAATTNGSAGNNTFGMTSGTSNCVDDAGMAKLDTYIETNQVALASEMARGEGETLAGVAKILGCSDVGSVNSALKRSYEQVFPSKDVGAGDVANSIRRVLQSSRASCQNLG